MGQTINQVRHLYVATSYGNPDNVGDIQVIKASKGAFNTPASGNFLPKSNADILYFKYMSPGGLVCSDKIDMASIIDYRHVSAHKLRYYYQTKKVTLNEELSDTPIAGQEYILKVAFRNYIGLGDEDTTVKFGMVTATAADAASVSTFYKKLAISLANNVAKDTTPLVKIMIADNGTEVKAGDKLEDITGEATGIYLQEVEQPWELGKMSVAYIQFDASTSTITVEGIEDVWGKVEKVKNTTAYAVNGKKIADLEYFCMGARGDYYRGMGYPNTIKTEYLVDPTLEYDALEIHYEFTDSNEGSQKSEKQITIVGPSEVIDEVKAKMYSNK